MAVKKPRTHHDAAPIDPETGEELLVLWELMQTAQLATRAFRKLCASANLAPRQFGILACLADGDDFSKAQLADALMIRPQSVDPLVEGLVNDGLVARDGPPRRGRAAGISITASGLERLTRIRPEVIALNAPHKVGIEADRLPLLVAQLRNIRHQLQL